MSEELREIMGDMADRELLVLAADVIGDESSLYVKHEVSCLGESWIVCSRYLGDPSLDDDWKEDTQPEWRRLFKEMRHALALCFQPGVMVLGSDFWEMEEWDAAKAAFDSLSEEERRIDFAFIGRALARESKALEKEAKFWMVLHEFHKAQQEHPDEDLSVRDAYERHQKGTEDLRRRVEGEEEGKEEPQH